MTEQFALNYYAEKMDSTIEDAKEMYEIDYLSIFTGRDGKEYLWYLDEEQEWAVDEEGKELSQEEIEELFL